MKLFFFLKEGIIGLKRARLSATIAISSLCVALTLIGLFSILFVNLKDSLYQLYREIEIEAFIDPTLSSHQVNALQQKLEQFPEIQRVTFISREQALKEFQNAFGENLQQVLKENPLPASFRIVLHSTYSQPDNVARIADHLQKLQGISEVLYQKEIIQFLSKYLKLGLTISLFIALSMIAIITILVYNTIRLTIYARRNIIQIMQLVGATNRFIKGPFIYEGILQGLIGGVCSAIVLIAVNSAIKYFFYSSLRVENYILIGLIGIGILLGLVGSYFSVNKYLE